MQENSRAIDDGKRVEFAIGVECGLLKQETIITIGHDAEGFQSDWPYKANTFPCRIKALAQALFYQSLFGSYRASHVAGRISLMREVDKG